MEPSRSWRRNLFAVTAASFIGFTGFTLVMPFLPLYFRELGVADVGEIALWTGFSLGVTPAMTAVLAPLWGRMADRFGRKIMVERSLASFVVVMAAMAWATEAWHVLALRVLQGFFAGYGALALTMAADSAPPGGMASAIGTVQTAQRLGPALGPVIGGVVAGIVGLRRAFLVAAAFYAAGFVLVLLSYSEGRRRPSVGGEGQRAAARPTWRGILGIESFGVLMGAMFLLQFADRSLGPILPLFLSGLGVPLPQVPLISGVLFSVAAGAGALGNTLCPRLLKRLSVGAVLAGAATVAATAALVLAARPRLALVSLAVAAFGASVGTAMTTAYTAGGDALPPDVRATGFGFLTSASLTGLALSPIAAGLLGAIDIRWVFVVDALAMGALALIALRRMRVRALGVTRPPGGPWA
jgi:MFS family permease